MGPFEIVLIDFIKEHMETQRRLQSTPGKFKQIEDRGSAGSSTDEMNEKV